MVAAAWACLSLCCPPCTVELKPGVPVAFCLSASDEARGPSEVLLVFEFEGATAPALVSEDDWGVVRLGAAAGS